MESVLTARAALIQALYLGPGYGNDLMERMKKHTLSSVRLRPGTVYPTLRALEKEGLVRNWNVIPGGKRGARTRIYYELSPKGLAVAEAQRKALIKLITSRVKKPSPCEVRLMRERLRSCAEVSDFSLKLQDGMRPIPN